MEFGFSITALGAALNAKLLAGSTLSISKVMVGSGKATAGTDLTTMTALITPVALATSNTPAVGANNTVSIIVEYRNDLNGGLKEGFWINEVGLFATDPDAGEILYAYATLGDYPQHIRPYAADAICHGVCNEGWRYSQHHIQHRRGYYGGGGGCTDYRPQCQCNGPPEPEDFVHRGNPAGEHLRWTIACGLFGAN